MQLVHRLVVLAALALASGCSHNAKPAQEADASHAGDTQNRAVADAVKANQGGELHVSDDIRRLCPGLKPPEFSFDSASVQRSWTEALRGLADCMKTGGLAGKRVVLTGHTDPRGEEDYNVALGGRRAEAVKRAVTTFGVDGGRLDTTSRGETDATGTDDASWAHDRRVDIDLASDGRVSSN